MEWVLVIPVKRLAIAKSRIGAAWSPYRPDLALAFAQDTVSAALAATAVRAVIVVTDDEVVRAAVEQLGAEVVADEPDAGQNAAVRHGAARRPPHNGVAALSADLPALRSIDLDAALSAAAAYPSAFVHDLAGTGTTMLTAGPGLELAPAFGPGSRAAHHAAGAVDLAGGWASLRRDVDTVEDLLEARALGVGPMTAAIVQRLTRSA